ncbi:MAG: thioredoxin domain-containing protein [Pseudomonadota bacterium]|nr:thioredoxin domain-containing protein [Pseudomonadota bacterium]
MLLLLLACVRPPAPTVDLAPPASDAYGPSMPRPQAAVLTPVPVDVPLDPSTASIGPADARVVVVTYSDFQCPFCAHLFPLVVSLAERRPDIRFVFGSYPLNQDCNPMVTHQMHRYACDAALAASCANAQGRYVPIAELLYQYPEHITPPELPAFVERAGLDRAAFDTCFADPASRQALREHVAAGVALGIEGTPTVYARGLAGQEGWVQVTGDAAGIVAALEAAPR